MSPILQSPQTDLTINDGRSDFLKMWCGRWEKSTVERDGLDDNNFCASKKLMNCNKESSRSYDNGPIFSRLIIFCCLLIKFISIQSYDDSNTFLLLLLWCCKVASAKFLKQGYNIFFSIQRISHTSCSFPDCIGSVTIILLCAQTRHLST